MPPQILSSAKKSPIKFDFTINWGTALAFASIAFAVVTGFVKAEINISDESKRNDTQDQTLKEIRDTLDHIKDIQLTQTTNQAVTNAILERLEARSNVKK